VRRFLDSSDLERLGEPGQNLETIPGHHSVVLDPDSPDSGEVKARFDGQHLACFKSGLRDSGLLVNLKSESVPEPVEKPDPTAIPIFFGIPFLLEKFSNFLLQGCARTAGSYLMQGVLLRL
jgi:hypothetical protein